MKDLRTINTLADAMDCVEALKGGEWHTGGSFEIGEGALVSGSDCKGKIAHILIALIAMDSVDLSEYKGCGETFEQYVISPISNGKFIATQHIQIEASRFVQNIELVCSYFDHGVSLRPLYKLIGTLNQSLQFTKEYLESLILSKPLSRLVLASLLKQNMYDSTLADLFRFHINKTNRYRYVGIYLDEKIDNIGYTSGRILATMEYIANLSENREPLRLNYARFSTSPAPMLPKLAMIAKKYIYTVPQLGRQIYLKNLLDSLLDKAKDYQSTKRYLSDNDQAMFAIGYKHQSEYFVDESFTSKFQVLNGMRQSDNVS
ncbi:MAG: type I-C CRISPR-associated protein Cas8c/Csd1 [Rikenellaceae bacterium]